MKRHFLSVICTLALLAFMGQDLAAQEATTPSTAEKVVIIQKTQNDDGTWSVKKKSVQKGEGLETYLKEIDIENPVETISEVIFMTGDEAKAENPEAETIIMIRRGSNKTEIKWNDSEGGDQPMFNWNHDQNMDRHFDRHNSNFALIGDETTEPKPFLGIYPERHENGGVLVTDIVPGAGAAAAGMQSGDIIISIDGKTLASRGGLSNTLSAYKPGDKVEVAYLREGQSLTSTVELTTRKTPHRTYNFDYQFDNKTVRNPCEVFIGVTIGSWGKGEDGVGVDGIIPGWPAEEAGIQTGDRILSIDDVDVNTHNELVVQRDKHKAGEYFNIEYLRDGKISVVKARFKTCPGQEAPEQVVVEDASQPELPKVANTLEVEELNAYPNPTLGNLNVTFKGDAVPTTVTITDITGKTIFNETVKGFDGLYNREVDVSAGAPGTLTITIRQEGKVLSKPVVLMNRA